MKLLVILENHFFEDLEGNIWCKRVINYEFLRRYLDVFNEVIVCGRTKKIINKEKDLLLVSGKRIKFVPLPEFVGIKGLILNLHKVKTIIEKILDDVDCVLYRAPTHLALFTYKKVLKKNKVLALEFMMAADKMIEGKGFINFLLNSYIDKKTKKMCMKADCVSYVTERVLQQKYPCKAIKYINNKSYYTTSYSTIDLNDSNFYNQKWDVNNKPNVFEIVHTGYMDSYRKGQDIVIKAVAEIINRGYKVKLNLIGDGKRKNEFEKLVKDLKIEEYVNFLGLINSEQKILDILRNSHLFVFPTLSEGLPRVIIEAMSQGLPCISSPVDGIVELLDNEFLIKDRSYMEYANKIIDLINDWPKMIEVGKQNFIKSHKYSNKCLRLKRKEFYNKILEISKERCINEKNKNS